MQLIYPVTQRGGAEYDRSCSYNEHGPCRCQLISMYKRIKKIIMKVSRKTIHFTIHSNVYDVKKPRSKLIRRTWG